MLHKLISVLEIVKAIKVPLKAPFFPFVLPLEMFVGYKMQCQLFWE
jgi:hypothetical protein